MTELVSSLTAGKQIYCEAEVPINDDECFNPISKLQDMGINAADITKLKASGILTTLGVIQTTRKELCGIKGFSEAKVEKLLEVAMKIEGNNPFISAAEVLVKRSGIVRLTSGSVSLDNLLGNGFESSSISEIFGENRTGKTQICHTLCVTGQLPLELGGGNGRICYIDTEGTFRPEKISRIADRFEVDGNTVLDNIMYARAHTHEHMNFL